jgi:hypothetical protein
MLSPILGMINSICAMTNGLLTCKLLVFSGSTKQRETANLFDFNQVLSVMYIIQFRDGENYLEQHKYIYL